MTEAAKDAAPNAVGRPSELTEEVMTKALFYLCDGFKKAGDIVPSVAGLACFLGKARSRMYVWAGQSDEFKDMLESITTVQERMLVNGGLGGDFNPTITKLMMAKHGYVEKVEQDHKSSDKSMTPKANLTKDEFKEVLRSANEKI